MVSYRSSKSFGERYEYRAISELLEHGYDVYKTLIDDQGIDCIIRKVVNDSPKYVVLQIKARSETAKDPATFSAMDIKNPRANYAFMFYSERLDEFWIIPSIDLVKGLAYQNKNGKNKGKFRLDLSRKQKDKPQAKPEYDKYCGQKGFDVIEDIFRKLP